MHDLTLLVNISAALAAALLGGLLARRLGLPTLVGVLLPNPSPDVRLFAGDRLALIGDRSQVSAAQAMLAASATR
jgi:CPA2 family monovalent cation:H+ antiporter-2